MKATHRVQLHLNMIHTLKALCTATAYLTIQSTFPCTKANTYSAWMHSSLQSITKTYKLSYTWLRLDKNNKEYNKLKINTGELLFLFCLQVGVWTQSLARALLLRKASYTILVSIRKWNFGVVTFFKFLTQAQWKVVFEPTLSGVRHSRVLNKAFTHNDYAVNLLFLPERLHWFVFLNKRHFISLLISQSVCLTFLFFF